MQGTVGPVIEAERVRVRAFREAVAALTSQLSIPGLRAKEAAQDARENVAVAVGRLGGCFGRAHLRW